MYYDRLSCNVIYCLEFLCSFVNFVVVQCNVSYCHDTVQNLKLSYYVMNFEVLPCNALYCHRLPFIYYHVLTCNFMNCHEVSCCAMYCHVMTCNANYYHASTFIVLY